MKTVKLVKIKEQYLLPIPESFVNLYSFKSGQSFSVEIKESINDRPIVILTLATEFT